MQRVQSWFRIWFHAVFCICLHLSLYQSRIMLVLMRSVSPRHPNLQWTVCLCSLENTAVSSLVLRPVWCCCSWDIRFHWELGSRVGVELVGLDRHISPFFIHVHMFITVLFLSCFDRRMRAPSKSHNEYQYRSPRQLLSLRVPLSSGKCCVAKKAPRTACWKRL